MATETTPSFLSVPAELFERFAQFAKPEDLLTLRLTCKDAAAKVLRTYTEVHFSHRHILLSEETNLRHAIEVAQHPVFGPALKKLSIHLDELEEPDELCGLDIDHPSIFAEEESNYETQEEFKKNKLDLYLLTIILAHIRRIQARPEVLLSARELEQHIKLRFDNRRDGRSYQRTYSATNRPFVTVMEALVLANLDIRSLKAPSGSAGILILRTNRLTPKEFGVTAEALRSIRHLDIALGRDCSFLSDKSMRSFRDFADVLASTSVEVLNLEIAMLGMLGQVLEQFSHHHFHKLLKFTIKGVFHWHPLSMSQLIGFIRKQPLLQEFCIAGVSRFIDIPDFFPTEPNVKTLEAALKQCCGLSKVVFTERQQYDDEDESDDSEEASEGAYELDDEDDEKMDEDE